MGKEFNITPQAVPRVETQVSPHCHPVAASGIRWPRWKRLRNLSPSRCGASLLWSGNAPRIFSVFDKYGNRWIDWSSGVLVTNAGHGAPEIKKAIVDQVQSGLIYNYVFPSEERAALVECLAGLAPRGLEKIFLLTTGSEAVECAIKLSRAHGIKVGGKKKIGIVGFERGFHGRTLGSQQAGGIAGQKSWIVNEDPAIINVPFPDGYWQTNTNFDTFLDAIQQRGLKAENIAGVVMESYQGVGPDFAPTQYIR